MWPQVQPIIDRALVHSHGRLDASSQFDLLINGTDNLWVATKDDEIIAAIVTEVATLPTGMKLLICLFCAGKEFSEWSEEMHQKLVSFAKDNDCKAMELTGRKGWTRLLKRWDWETEYTVFRKEL